MSYWKKKGQNIIYDKGSLVVSVNDNGPVLTVLDDGDYSIGEMTLDLQFESNKTYDISVERYL